MMNMRKKWRKFTAALAVTAMLLQCTTAFAEETAVTETQTVETVAEAGLESRQYGNIFRKIRERQLSIVTKKD